MTKKDRHELILKLISEREIDGQQDLCDNLLALGVEVTQATISRDINELKLIKVEGITKKFRYARPFLQANVSSGSVAILQRLVVSVTTTSVLIVIKTLNGSANTVANIIDEASFINVLGTIAGDDTIFIALNSKQDAEIVSQKIKDLIKNA